MYRLALLGLLLGCRDKAGEETGQTAWRPDVVCPGDAGCESAEGPLSVGAAALAITPTCYETWEDLDGNGEYDRSTESYFDCGCDRLCEGDDGYPGPDEGEEDGTFQAVYMAGFSMNRPMAGVHDDIWARAVVFSQGETTIAVVSLDLIGLFNNEVTAVREQVAEAGIDVDHIIISSTHTHEGPDTLGQWGKQIGESGYDPEYVAFIREQIVSAVGQAVDELRPATLRIAQADISTYSEEKGSRNVVYDHRDPKIIDKTLSVAHAVDDSGQTIATVVNFANHPESLSSDNILITSDFVHATRQGIEEGVTYDDYAVEGVGGVCVYISGAVGGMMSPLQVEVTDGSGQTYSEASYDKAEALGNVMAELALGALADAEIVTAPSLAVRTTTFMLPIDNVAFQAAFLLNMFNRPVYGVDTAEMDFLEETPLLLTEVDVFDLGPIRMLSIPGELLPELALGGYDASEGQPFTPLETLIDEGNVNPPDLDAAPAGPYLFDRMGGEQNWIIGLGNDEVGYIIPPYNYQLHDGTPYLQEAEGDHYEETNSLGPDTAPLVEEAVIQLLEWSP